MFAASSASSDNSGRSAGFHRKQTTLKRHRAPAARSRGARRSSRRAAAPARCAAPRCSRIARAPYDPQNHPELERAKAAAELHARVHQIPDGACSGRPQILGCERERLAQDVHAPAVERAEIERREQPLVRVDDERVGAFGACQQVRVRRQHRRPRRRTPRPRAARARSRSQMSAIAGTGSMLVVDVVPTVATTAIGRMPAARSAADAPARADRAASGSDSSDGDPPERVAAQADARSSALSTDECACSEQ